LLCPSKGFCHRSIEILNKFQNPSPQIRLT
jgi:hypothetical protein